MSDDEKVTMTKRELEVLLDYEWAKGHWASVHGSWPQGAKATIEELRLAVNDIRERHELPVRP